MITADNQLATFDDAGRLATAAAAFLKQEGEWVLCTVREILDELGVVLTPEQLALLAFVSDLADRSDIKAGVIGDYGCLEVVYRPGGGSVTGPTPWPPTR